MGEKSVENLLRRDRGVEVVAASRACSPDSAFVSSASRPRQILAGDFGSIDAIAAARSSELQHSDGIGPEVAAQRAVVFSAAG